MITGLLNDLQEKRIIDLLLQIQSYLTEADLSSAYTKGHKAVQLIERELNLNPVLLNQLHETNRAILSKDQNINNCNIVFVDFHKKNQEIIGQIFNVMSYALLSSTPLLQARYNAHQVIYSQKHRNSKTYALSVKAAKENNPELKPWEISLRVHPDIFYLELGEMLETTDEKLQEVLTRLSEAKKASQEPLSFIFLKASDIMDQAYKILNTISAALLLKTLGRTHPDITKVTVYIPGFTGNSERDFRIILLDDPQNTTVYTNNNAFHCKISEAVDSSKVTISFSAQDIEHNLNNLWSVKTDTEKPAEDAKKSDLPTLQPRLKTTIQPIECLPHKYQPQHECIDSKTQDGNAVTKDIARDAPQTKLPNNETSATNNPQTTSLTESTLPTSHSLPGQHSELSTMPNHIGSPKSQNEKVTTVTECTPNKPIATTSLNHKNAVPGVQTPKTQLPDFTDNLKSNSTSTEEKQNKYGAKIITGFRTVANTITNAGQKVARKFNSFLDKRAIGKQNQKTLKPTIRQSKLAPLTAHQAQPVVASHNLSGHAQEQQQLYCHCHHNAALQNQRPISTVPAHTNLTLLGSGACPAKDIAKTPKAEMRNTPIIEPFKPGFRDCVYGDSFMGLLKQYLWMLLARICSILRLSKAGQYFENNFLIQHARATTAQQPGTQTSATEKSQNPTTSLTSVQAENPNTPTKSRATSCHIPSKIEYKPSKTVVSNNNGTEIVFAPNKEIYAETAGTKVPTNLSKARTITNTVLHALGA